MAKAKKGIKITKETRRKNLIVLVLIIAFIILFYFISIIKMKTV